MEQVIINDAQTRRLTLMWWALAVYMLLPIVGYWVQPAYKISCMLSRCLIPVVIGCLMTSLSDRQNNSIMGNVLRILLVGIILYMYLCLGKNLFTISLYLKEYTILPFSFCLLLFLPAVPLLRSFIKVNYALSIIGSFIVLIPIGIYTDNSYIQFIFETVILGAGFVLISGKYHTKKHLLWATACLLIGLLSATVTGRRNLMLTIGLYLLVGGVQFVFGHRIKSAADRFLLLISVVAFCFIAIFFYLMNSRGLFSVITARATENTRDYVFLNFALDMDPRCILIGRGMNGKYLCPGVAGGDEYRNVIENGYMQAILNGGLLYLLTYLTIVIYAIVKGFKARNQLLHACAWLLTVQLIDMLPFGLHAFNVKTFMLWMSVALCLDRSLWAKDDDEIQGLLTEPSLRLPPWDRSRTAEAPVR